VLVVGISVSVTSAVIVIAIRAMRLDVSTALPTAIGIISLAATVFFGVVGMRPAAQAAGNPTAGASAGGAASTVPVPAAPVSSVNFIAGAAGTPYAGVCVDVRGPSSAPDTPVQVWGCEQVDEMRWHFTGTGEIQGYGGNCLTVVGDDTDGTPVLMEPCNGTAEQLWQLASDGHLSYSAGRCLDIQGPSANDGTALQIWQCQDVPEELWRLT
jgi:hypothetical protein